MSGWISRAKERLFDPENWATYHVGYLTRFFDLIWGGTVCRVGRLCVGPRPSDRNGWLGELGLIFLSLVIAACVLFVALIAVFVGDITSHPAAFALAALGWSVVTEWQGRSERAARYRGETPKKKFDFVAAGGIFALEISVVALAYSLGGSMPEPVGAILLGCALAASADLTNLIWTPALMAAPWAEALLAQKPLAGASAETSAAARP